MTNTIELALAAGWPEIALKMASKDELEKLEAFAELVKAEGAKAERARLLAVAVEPVAQLDLQEQRFSWTMPTTISVPLTVQIPQYRLYGEDQVAAAVLREREECANVCESRQTPGTGSVAILNGAADAIRARGEG